MFLFFFYRGELYARANCSSYSSEFQRSVWHRLNLADNATARSKKPGVRGSKIKHVYSLAKHLFALKKYTYVLRSKNQVFARRLFAPLATTSHENRCKSDRDVNKSRRCIPKLLVRSARAWIHAARGYNKSVET